MVFMMKVTLHAGMMRMKVQMIQAMDAHDGAYDDDDFVAAEL